MRDVINEITPYPEYNIFNGICDIPLIKYDEFMLYENKHMLLYRDNIYRHKSFMNSMLMNKNIPAYGESYVFRGAVKMPKNQKFESKIDMKVVDQIIATPEEYPPIFAEDILEYYQPEQFEEDLTENQI